MYRRHFGPRVGEFGSDIVQSVFEVWMRLLRRVEGSVLWLFGKRGIVEENLRRQARECGVDPDRLVFAQRRPLADYLAQYRLADIFLDTFPYKCTTCSDALWAGLRVITCAGRSFASRMGCGPDCAPGYPLPASGVPGPGQSVHGTPYGLHC
jgi:predicted O-linked N-acetylglucosamine transferase (SPINDLY family)